MNQETLRKHAWEEMLFAQMRSNYFADLCRRYSARERWAQAATLAFSSAAVAAVVASLPEVLKWGFPLVAAGISFGQLTWQPSALARAAADLHQAWLRHATEYERLWNALQRPDAEAEFQRIYESADRLSPAALRFPIRKKLLEKWLDHASALALARYAHPA